MVAKRVELEKPIEYAGQPALLYASSGPWDDYVELTLPESINGDAARWQRLAGSSSAKGRGELDLRFHAGPPPMVALLALYAGDPDGRSLSYSMRLQGLVRHLRGLEPKLQFGSLLADVEDDALASDLDVSPMPILEVEVEVQLPHVEAAPAEPAPLADGPVDRSAGAMPSAEQQAASGATELDQPVSCPS
jgi:hypothetical protein